MLSREKLLSLLSSLITPYHYISYARERLISLGFTEVPKKSGFSSNLPPGKYFHLSKSNSLFALNITDLSQAFLFGVNPDFPCLKYKNDKSKIIWRTTQYGDDDVFSSTWIDRDLKIAGMCKIKLENKEIQKLFISENPCAKISSNGLKVSGSNPFKVVINESTLSPLPNCFYRTEPNFLNKVIATELNCDIDIITSRDVFLVDSQGPKIVGVDDSLLVAEGIDNLVGSILGFEAFLKSEPKAGLIGFLSVNKYGKDKDKTLMVKEIFECMGLNELFIKKSTLISLGCFNAYHPNYSELFKDKAIIRIGDGLIYDSNSLDVLLILKKIANDLKMKIFENEFEHKKNSLAYLFSLKLNMKTVEIGIPILAKHSIRETCDISDINKLDDFLSALVQNVNKKLF